MEIKERPILFNADMVRAILDGRKTQTRRIIKNPMKFKNGLTWDIHNDSSFGECFGKSFHVDAPYGKPGDRLWVRETLAARVNHTCGQDACDCGDVTITYAADNEERFFNDDSSMGDFCINGRKMIPSIHMPRWASRITLEITNVRVERLQDISNQDSVAEGIQELPSRRGYYDPLNPSGVSLGLYFKHARDAYFRLWDSIYGEESLQQNPWVWVIEFERVNP